MENVMLNTFQTQVKIVDFGLSNIFSEENPLRTHCGSPEYAAPELFVEGKHYGPEVDLWSLGVILYGMVVGQLPFVTTREENVSSQQRRRKLLEQINKGLSNVQKKALTIFTQEFRTMMSKLLTADITKRMTVKQLIFHPWITEKGKKAIRSNPMKKLDERLLKTIHKEIGILLQIDETDVRNALKCDSQGNIGGMYNIMHFRQSMRLLEGDGITRKNHDTTNALKLNLKEVAKPESARIMKIHDTKKRHESCKSAPPAKANNEKQSNTVRSGYSKATTAHHREIVQKPLSKRTNELPKSSVTTKQNEITKPNKIEIKQKRYIQSLIPTSKRLADDLKKRNSIETVSTPKRVAVRPQTTGPTTREKASMLPATARNCTRSRPDTSIKRRCDVAAAAADTANSKILTKPIYPWERSKEAGGDCGVAQQNRAKKPMKNPFLNEPIARSIAGYVVNNISNNITALRWIKGGGNNQIV